MSSEKLNQIRSMTDVELATSIRVVRRQVNAKFLVGDRDERREVLRALEAEKSARGY